MMEADTRLNADTRSNLDRILDDYHKSATYREASHVDPNNPADYSIQFLNDDLAIGRRYDLIPPKSEGSAAIKPVAVVILGVVAIAAAIFAISPHS